jgi:hypothetical protein
MENTSLLEINEYLRGSKIPVFNLHVDNQEHIEGLLVFNVMTIHGGKSYKYKYIALCITLYMMCNH